MSERILEVRNLTKLYPGVVALDEVSFDLHPGEVHALMGENGAGKSTLIKAISGAIRPDGGQIIVDGREYEALTPRKSRELGIEVIYQELNLMPSISVAENICLGGKHSRGALMSQRKMREEAEKIFGMIKVRIDPDAKVKDLTTAYMQLVEIAKAISKNSRILIMDEPTAPLSVEEVGTLFEIINTLKRMNVAIVYISHRINEVFEISDRITVMRDGKWIATLPTAETNRQQLIRLMVGRDVSEGETFARREPGEVILQARKLCGNGVRDISFEVRRGEVLGFAGLVGAGRTETMRMIFGADKLDSGEILLDGRALHIHSPKAALREGIGYVPEDRKLHGVLLKMTIHQNIIVCILRRLSRLGVISERASRSVVREQFDALRIKAPSTQQSVGNLSGGNQQKVVLAKWLAAQCRVLILDEPTRGIDVGARAEIYQLIRHLCDQGIAIVLISSDMEELLNISDRLAVMAEGRLAGTLERAQFDQELILSMASGNQ